MKINTFGSENTSGLEDSNLQSKDKFKNLKKKLESQKNDSFFDASFRVKFSINDSYYTTFKHDKTNGSIINLFYGDNNEIKENNLHKYGENSYEFVELMHDINNSFVKDDSIEDETNDYDELTNKNFDKSNDNKPSIFKIFVDDQEEETKNDQNTNKNNKEIQTNNNIYLSTSQSVLHNKENFVEVNNTSSIKKQNLNRYKNQKNIPKKLKKIYITKDTIKSENTFKKDIKKTRNYTKNVTKNKKHNRDDNSIHESKYLSSKDSLFKYSILSLQTTLDEENQFVIKACDKKNEKSFRKNSVFSNKYEKNFFNDENKKLENKNTIKLKKYQKRLNIRKLFKYSINTIPQKKNPDKDNSFSILISKNGIKLKSDIENKNYNKNINQFDENKIKKVDENVQKLTKKRKYNKRKIIEDETSNFDEKNSSKIQNKTLRLHKNNSEKPKKAKKYKTDSKDTDDYIKETAKNYENLETNILDDFSNIDIVNKPEKLVKYESIEILTMNDDLKPLEESNNIDSFKLNNNMHEKEKSSNFPHNRSSVDLSIDDKEKNFNDIQLDSFYYEYSSDFNEFTNDIKRSIIYELKTEPIIKKYSIKFIDNKNLETEIKKEDDLQKESKTNTNINTLKNTNAKNKNLNSDLFYKFDFKKEKSLEHNNLNEKNLQKNINLFNDHETLEINYIQNRKKNNFSNSETNKKTKNSENKIKKEKKNFNNKRKNLSKADENKIKKLKKIPLSNKVSFSYIKEKMNIRSMHFKHLPKNNIKKIGEASFSEVFLIDNLVYKIIPFTDNLTTNDFYKECYINNILKEEKDCIKLIDYLIVHGCYPTVYQKAWEDFEGGENKRPRGNHFYGVLILEKGGVDLEKFKFKGLKEVDYFLKEILRILYNLENKLEFEHRDLHWGNLLIERIENNDLNQSNDIFKKEIKNHEENNNDKIWEMKNNDLGSENDEIVFKPFKIKLIDFSLSRLNFDKKIVYTNLDNKKWLFEGDEDVDLQFGIYKKIKAENNEWSAFNPNSNFYWFEYLIKKVEEKVGKNVVSDYFKKLTNSEKTIRDLYLRINFNE
ncbi:Serine/threonine-protein kinase haspin [Gurleya vavrai]